MNFIPCSRTSTDPYGSCMYLCTLIILYPLMKLHYREPKCSRVEVSLRGHILRIRKAGTYHRPAFRRKSLGTVLCLFAKLLSYACFVAHTFSLARVICDPKRAVKLLTFLFRRPPPPANSDSSMHQWFLAWAQGCRSIVCGCAFQIGRAHLCERMWNG